MKKNLLLIALVSTIGFISCNPNGMNSQNGQNNGKVRSRKADCNKKSSGCKSCGCSTNTIRKK